MWLYLAVLVGLYFLHRWYQERQIVENLTEKYAFITGCDSGFGNQLARQLDVQGLHVLAACLTHSGAEQLGKATSERLRTTILDVTSTESVVAATEWVKGYVGSKGLWGLVNNAGIAGTEAPNEWLTKDDFAKVINVNLLGLIDVTLHMLPLVKMARGRIVNVSSVFGRIVGSGGGYCPSKYGVEAFSDSLRRDLHPFGVQVSIVEPGGFRTNLIQDYVAAVQNAWRQLPSDVKECYGEQYVEASIKLYHNMVEMRNTNLRLITDCIEHALTSCCPRTRYSAGWDAKLIIPASYLPATVTDYVMRCILPKPLKTI